MQNSNEEHGASRGVAFTHKGKEMYYCPKMQRRYNAIHVLKDEGIISDKEYYILRHRIAKELKESPSPEIENGM